MADKQIRLVYPNLPTGTDYSAEKYQPVPAWGTYSDRDYPTVRSVSRTDASNVTKKVIPIEGGSSYNLSSISANNNWSATNGASMWDWNGGPIRFSGTTNPMSMIIGHTGPQSADNSEQSWQRGVTGISMYHVNDSVQEAYYGHYIDEMTLLYRKGSDTGNQWHGVDLIFAGNLQSNCRKNHDKQTPFKTNSPRRGGSEGGFYVCIDNTSNVYKKINEEDYVFQGVYFLWGSYENNSQFTQRLELSKMRLIYDTYSSLDSGGRICANKLDSFQNSWNRSRPLKIT